MMMETAMRRLGRTMLNVHGIRKAAAHFSDAARACTVDRPRSAGSGSSDEGDNDIGGVPVEVLASAVVDRGRAGVGVAGGELDVT